MKEFMKLNIVFINIVAVPFIWSLLKIRINFNFGVFEKEL